MKRAREYITPNDIRPSVGSPLPGAFNKREAECAAAIIVYYLQGQGTWAPFSRKQVADWIALQMKAGDACAETLMKELLKELMLNPFVRPDEGFFVLLDKGWVIPLVESEKDSATRMTEVTDEFILRARLSSLRLKPDEYAAYAALETLPIGPLVPT